MPSGRARFNRPATAAARLTGKAPAIETPITDQLRRDIAARVGELRPTYRRRQPDAQDFHNLVEQLVSAADWASGQIRSLKEALTAAEKIAECKIVSGSLKRTITCLRKMSWDVDLALGHDFDGAGIADEAEALARKLDDVEKRLALVLSSRSTGKGSAKPNSISERSRIADELAIRVAESIKEASLKVTASPDSPAVLLVRFIGEQIRLRSDESTWRDRMNRANNAPRQRPRPKR